MLKRTPFVLAASLVLMTAFAAAPSFAQSSVVQPRNAPNQQSNPAPIILGNTADGLAISLGISGNPGVTVQSSEKGLSSSLPLVRIGDVLLPGQLVTVILDTTSDAKFAKHAAVAASESLAQSVASVDWNGEVKTADIPIARTIDGELMPDLTRQASTALPKSPVSIISESDVRGVRLAVVAVTPIFEQNGQARYAAQFNVTLPGARQLDEQSLAQLLALFDPRVADKPFANVAPAGSALACSDPSIQPKNPQASKQAWRIKTARAGIQHVSASALTEAGLSSVPLSQFHLQYRGQDVAIRRLGNEFRFHAPEPGDRWNATDTFWLTVEPGAPSPDMVTTPASASGSPNTTAIERGIFVNNKIYDSAQAGGDRDHWFAADLRPFNATASWLITPTLVLPSSGGTTLVTISGASSTNNTHSLQFESGGESDNTTVSGVGPLTATFSLSNFGTSAKFSAQPLGKPEIVRPDRAIWERPVSLNFGSNGGAFIIRGGSDHYLATGTPAQGNDRLYDVTNPLAPAVVGLSGAPTDSDAQFLHGGGDRNYIMAGAGTLFVSGQANGPAIVAYSHFPLDAPLNKNALYIAPNAFLGAIQPLINHRNAQGYAAAVINAELIYDWWSFGQVSPDAIRNFLRYAYACWSIKPFVVTLVGDGTSDPLNYLGYNHVNYIPPYLAPVDPYIASVPEPAETACDACYAQLDGDNPLSDRLPELLFGRLPAKNVVELANLVNKIIGYENAPLNSGGDARWRSRISYLADNYKKVPPEVPSGVGFDNAGDFESFSETSISQQPKFVQIQRMYYDPTAAGWDGVHEPSSTQAYNRSKAVFDAGAAIINYAGHANVAQLAVTQLNAQYSYLLQLLDADAMQNAGRLSIVVQMTCLTSAFQDPIQGYATVLDERLVLAPNGAVATWGSSGLGVSYGHEALQRGFYKALWSQPISPRTVGQAAQGGYVELFGQSQGSGSIDDSLRTFLILGDPLTVARVAQAVNLPFVHR